MEKNGNQYEIKQGGRDIEQKEIEHDVDALGPAFNYLGNRACPPVHMEAHRQIMQVAEDIFGQTPRRILPDTFKHDVAQIVE